MMPAAVAAAFAAFLALSAPAAAEDGDEPDCSPQGLGPSHPLCLSQAYEKADAELNHEFQRSLAFIDGVKTMTADERSKWAAALRAAQRQWIAFRDADCGEALDWEWFGGTGRDAAKMSCLLEKTKARTADLRQRYGG